MTPQEIQQALANIRSEVGFNAYVTLSIDFDHVRDPIYVAIYPYGLTKNEGYLHVRGLGFAETLDAIRDKWTEYKAQFGKKITQKMALAIIRLTDDFGACTDAALRDEFDPGQIASYGADACQLANTMAAKGPFTITALAGANAA